MDSDRIVTFVMASLSLTTSVIWAIFLLRFYIVWEKNSWLMKNFTHVVLLNLIISDLISAIYYLLPVPSNKHACSITAAVGALSPLSGIIWNFVIIASLLYFGWLKLQFFNKDELLLRVYLAFAVACVCAWLIPMLVVSLMGLLNLFGPTMEYGILRFYSITLSSSFFRCWITDFQTENYYFYCLFALTGFSFFAYFLLIIQQFRETHPWFREFGLYLPVFGIIVTFTTLVHFFSLEDENEGPPDQSTYRVIQFIGALVMPAIGLLNFFAWAFFPVHRMCVGKKPDYDAEDAEGSASDGGINFIRDDAAMSRTFLFGYKMAYMVPLKQNEVTKWDDFAFEK